MPKIMYATVREAALENDDTEYHIECRFEDGQKYAAIVVDGQHEELAHKIADWLNEQAKLD